MFVNSDFSELLKLFNDNRVRYLVIGGYAVIQYAEPRYTKDLDLWISADTENARAVYKVLREFGAPLAGLTVDDFAHEGYFYQMGVPPVRVDVLMRAYPELNLTEHGKGEQKSISMVCSFRSSPKKTSLKQSAPQGDRKI